MTAFATILAPVSYGRAVELSGRLWRKKVLPVGDIAYQGRTLHFTRSYLDGLAAAFADRAYDQVSFQLADSANSHTNDPERHRGTIVAMDSEPDGLYITLDPTPRGHQVLQDNPYLGVSARIVEQYARADGRFYPAAIQHVLGTLDPRIPGLGPWTAVEMSNAGGSAVIIDLSGARWAGDELSGAELADLIEAVTDVYGPDAEDYDEISDAELDAIIAAGTEDDVSYDDDGLAEFGAAFDRSYAAQAALEAARQQAALEDTIAPARRDEDRLARAVSRASQGLYGTSPALGFANEAAAVELAAATGRGPCGPLDEYGRCSSRYHALECAHGHGVDWLAESGAPRETYQAALANWSDGLDLAGVPYAVWGDTDDPDAATALIPFATVELAHAMAGDLGLFDDAPYVGAPGYDHMSTLLRPPAAPVSAYDAMAESIGYGGPPPEMPSYPGISELARSLGLKS
jgi:hypothetical protein